MNVSGQPKSIKRGRSLWISVLAVVLWGTISGAAAAAELVMQEIAYRTEDKVTIAGSWVTPSLQENTPPPSRAVILLHDYGFDRRDWGIVIPDLIQRGYAVLAIDLRGHGKSTEGGTRISRDSAAASGTMYTLDTGYKDVLGALQWVQSQKNIRRDQISLIGLGLGADITYFCARKFGKQLRSAIIISPSIQAIADGSFTGQRARGVLFCASTGDANGSSMMAAETMSNFSDQPKKVVVYQSNAHGLALFYKHPELLQEILAWLQ